MSQERREKETKRDEDRKRRRDAGEEVSEDDEFEQEMKAQRQNKRRKGEANMLQKLPFLENEGFKITIVFKILNSRP